MNILLEERTTYVKKLKAATKCKGGEKDKLNI